MTTTPATPPLTLSLEEIEALVEIEAAATPAPWCTHPNGTSTWRGKEYESSSMVATDHLLNASNVRLDERFGVANIDLAVEARNALPALLSMARRLLELESALTFLLHARDPDFDFGTKTGAQIELTCAERMGWDPTKAGR